MTLTEFQKDPFRLLMAQHVQRYRCVPTPTMLQMDDEEIRNMFLQLVEERHPSDSNCSLCGKEGGVKLTGMLLQLPPTVHQTRCEHCGRVGYVTNNAFLEKENVSRLTNYINKAIEEAKGETLTTDDLLARRCPHCNGRLP